MNKTDLILAVAEKAEVSKREAEDVIEAALAIVEAALIKGEAVKISGFGVLTKKERAQREGTNPSNQEKIVIPSSATVNLKVSKSLKEKLNG